VIVAGPVAAALVRTKTPNDSGTWMFVALVFRFIGTINAVVPAIELPTK